MLPGPGVTERTVSGPPFWPVQVFRSLGLLFLTAAVLALFAGLFEMNPVWLYGPFVPSAATVPAQPDWYVGWLEGALRLGPPFEPTVFGVTIASPFIPGIVVPGLLFGVLALWPFLEQRISGDRAIHHVLQWPWQAPGRTAIGSGILTFFAVLTLAGGNDVLAQYLSVRIDTLTLALQIALVVLPVVVGCIVYALCLARGGRGGGGERGRASGRVVYRNSAGGFSEARGGESPAIHESHETSVDASRLLPTAPAVDSQMGSDR